MTPTHGLMSLTSLSSSKGMKGGATGTLPPFLVSISLSPCVSLAPMEAVAPRVVEGSHSVDSQRSFSLAFGHSELALDWRTPHAAPEATGDRGAAWRRRLAPSLALTTPGASYLCWSSAQFCLADVFVIPGLTRAGEGDGAGLRRVCKGPLNLFRKGRIVARAALVNWVREFFSGAGYSNAHFEYCATLYETAFDSGLGVSHGLII